LVNSEEGELLLSSAPPCSPEFCSATGLLNAFSIMSTYHAVFRCAAGCPASTRSGSRSITARLAAASCKSYTTSPRSATEARRHGCARSTSATSGRCGRTAPVSGARRNGSAPRFATRTSCRWTRAARTCSGRNGSAEIGLGVVSSAAIRTGSFKDLRLTVLCRSSNRWSPTARAAGGGVRVDRRYLGVLAAYAAAAGLPAVVISREAR
jgi:hypothetical protein